MEIVFLMILLMLLVIWCLKKINKKVADQKNTDKLNTASDMNVSSINSPQNVVSLISEYFNKNNIRYWLSEDRKSFRVGFELESEGKFDVYINVDSNYILFNCAILEDIKDEAVANTLDIVARINQFYNLGCINFYFESRVVSFKNVYLLFENELTENKFKLYFDTTIDGARSCRPLISRVAIDGEEPIIAMMSIGNNNQ